MGKFILKLLKIVFIHCFLCRHNSIFKDVYREVGILEVFVGCLMKYSGFLQKHVESDPFESDPFDLELTNEEDIENGNFIVYFYKVLKLLSQSINIKIFFLSFNRSK